MTREELIKFLKENLKIEIHTEGIFETEVVVRIYIGEELITSDFFTV